MNKIWLRVFPFLGWFREMNGATVRADAISGLTVALVLIPQSIAYAQLAGLPPHYGLYAAFLPPMIASLFGSSRQLATGPVAVVSLMTAASLAPLAPKGSEGYIAYAVILAITVGLFQFALGVMRLGLVVNFLSHPVVNGFTNGAAIIIASSQLSKLFGVTVDEAPHQYETTVRVIEAAVAYTHWPSLLMGILAFGIMYGLKRLNPRVPYVLAAVVVTTFISWATHFAQDRKAVLADIASDEAAGLIKDYNAAIAKRDELANKRTEVAPRLMAAKRTEKPGSIPLLELTHAQAMLSAEIDEQTELAERLRAKLRGMLLSGVKDGDGMKFYVRGQVPAGISPDGHTWRLMVGMGALKTEELKMSGAGAVIGKLPPGLPKFALPKPRMMDLLTLLPYAAIISLLGFMEAISIAKAMAAKTGQFLDPNQELIGQGLANILGAFGSSYPTSGSFSRSAVNLQSGASSGLSSVVTSLSVVAVLLLFTPLMYHLPQATLAAVIMMAVVGLVTPSSFIHAWKTHRVDGAISLLTFVATLIFAPHLDHGIMVGVGLSLSVFMYNSMKPRVSNLALHPDQSYRDAEHWGLDECKHIAMIRYDGNLFFANVSYFEDLIKERVRETPGLRHILLVANGINDMDASGEEVLSLTVDNVRSAGIDFSISGVKESVLALMKRTHLYEKIGEDHIFSTQVIAIRNIFAKAHQGSDEQECPLQTVRYKRGPGPKTGE
jgi:sulfate permease, SulP family